MKTLEPDIRRVSDASLWQFRIAASKEVVNWEQTLKQKWCTLHFSEMNMETRLEQHVFEAQVYLDNLDSKVVRVELYANGMHGGTPVRQEMRRDRQLAEIRGILHTDYRSTPTTLASFGLEVTE